jgi:hypothetical protein
LYVLSLDVLAFKKDMVVDPLGAEPSGFDPIVARLVDAWEERGVNATSAGATRRTAMGGAGVVNATAVLSDAMTQLPQGWPYTRAAVARRPGMMARYTVTGLDGLAEGVVVRACYSLLFLYAGVEAANLGRNPRPLDGVNVLQNFTQGIEVPGTSAGGPTSMSTDSSGVVEALSSVSPTSSSPSYV